MSIPFQNWPDILAKHYRDQEFWQDRSLVSPLQQQVLSQPEKVALIDPQIQLTYQQLWQQSQRIAQHLHQSGIQSGDTGWRKNCR